MFPSTLYTTVTYVIAKFEVAMSKVKEMHFKANTLFDLCPWGKVAKNIAQFPLHHVTYAPGKFIVAMSNGLGGDAFTRKYII